MPIDSALLRSRGRSLCSLQSLLLRMLLRNVSADDTVADRTDNGMVARAVSCDPAHRCALHSRHLRRIAVSHNPKMSER